MVTAVMAWNTSLDMVCFVSAVKSGSGWLRCVEVSSGQSRRSGSGLFRLCLLC